MTSSPLPSPLPSPEAIRTIPSKPKPASRKVPIPLDAPTGFLSATNLVSKEELHADYTPPPPPPPPPNPPPPRRPSKTPSLEDYVYQDPSAPPQSKPAASGKLKRPAKTKAPVKDTDHEAPQEDLKVKPAPRKRATKKAVQDVIETADCDEPAAPAPKRSRKKAITAESTGELSAPVKRGRKPAARKGADTVQDANPPASKGVDQVPHVNPPPPKPPKRPVKPKDPDQTVSTVQSVPLLNDHVKERAGESLSPLTMTVPNHLAEIEAADPSGQKVHAQIGLATPIVSLSADYTALHEIDQEGDIASRHFMSKAVEDTDLPTLENEVTEPIIAPRRRNHWTPPPPAHLTSMPTGNAHQDDSLPPDPLDPDTHNLSEPASPLERPAFASLVGAFGYNDSEPVSRQPGDDTSLRPVVEPAPAKKKREPKKKAPPKEKAPLKPKAERKKREPKPKVPKPPKEPKPKAPKKAPKKPLTITALATAAYRQPPPEATGTSEVVTLTSYFQPQVDNTAQNAVTGPDGEMGPPQAVKRKSTGDKPASKRKKKNEPLPPTLESPEKAHETMKNQEWLFGTSSQLAAVESPAEYRDLQQAIQASEAFGSSQPMGSSQLMEAFRAASKARVPTAPHGTDLSIGQAHRDLWLSAARDSGQGTYAAEDELRRIADGSEFVNMLELPTMHIAPTTVVESHSAEETSAQAVPTLPEKEVTEQDDAHDSGYVDIDDISSVASATKVPTADAPVDYIVLSSSAPVATSEDLPSRSILRTLDPNASMHKQAAEMDGKTPSPLKQTIARAIGAAVESPISLISPAKRPVGRPRKVLDGSASEPVRLSTSPARSVGRPRNSASPSPGPRLDPTNPTIRRRRSISLSPDPPLSQTRPVGRPRKRLSLSPDSPLSQTRPVGRPRKTVKDTMTSLATPKPRGRPPKLVTAQSDLTPRSPKRPRLSKPTTSQPLLSSPYLDIDDISDAEAANSPPSPPKRRSKSPIIQHTLELSNPDVGVAHTLEKPSSEKHLQTIWPTISPHALPRITEAVKAQPKTTDQKNPSWNEKILLYDPIVLEDLTLWLNVQGVRVDVERLVKKKVVPPVKKGRKRKNKDEEGVVLGSEGDKGKGKEKESVEVEVVKEEIRPWMVQKWCELHSICCLWKEGLRGGVRQRY